MLQVNTAIKKNEYYENLYVNIFLSTEQLPINKGSWLHLTKVEILRSKLKTERKLVPLRKSQFSPSTIPTLTKLIFR
jgi:hypothetical protein